MYVSNIIYLETSEFYVYLTLTEEDSGTLEQEVDEGVMFTLSYENNIISTINNMDIVFGGTITPSDIPSIPVSD